jgi:adenosine deaminase
VTDRLDMGSRYEPRISPEDVAWIAALPKAELHVHLAGSLRPATALRLARERGLFGEISDQALVDGLQAPDACADQAELLDAFTMPMALLQDAESLFAAAAELVEDVAAEGTPYLELRFGPSNHVNGGLSLDEVITAVLAGIADGRGRTAITPQVGLIFIAMRTETPSLSIDVARAAADRRVDGVVGFDFAGLEATVPSIEPHLPAFDIAREAGLGITVHAGEWGGAAQVRGALRAQPSRIAHGGPTADDETLMAELRSRDVTLDLCPTSNVQAGLTTTMAQHPLGRLYRAGVPVTVSTDDRTVSATTLSRELALAMDPFGLERADIVAITRHALEVAFLQDDEATRARLLTELAAYEAATAA